MHARQIQKIIKRLRLICKNKIQKQRRKTILKNTAIETGQKKQRERMTKQRDIGVTKGTGYVC